MLSFKRSILIRGIAWMALSATMPWGAEASPKPVGKLGLIEGEVLVNGKAAKTGHIINEGAVIEVLDGKGVLIMGKDSIVHLDANSKMEITQYKDASAGGATEADLKLHYGKTRALVRDRGVAKNKFHFRTKTATMGVRGTHVYIDSPKDNAAGDKFMTIEGAAEVSTGKGPAIPLTEGKLTQTNAAPDTPPPPPVNVDKSEAKKMADEIAPPPRTAKTEGEVDQVAEKGADFKQDGPKPQVEQKNAQQIANSIPIDPIKDGSAGATVKFGIKKQ